MRLLAKCEGIVADPVYEGKSLVGLIELIEDGVLCRGSRPNPIGLHRVTVRAIDGGRLRVGPLEAIDGTPVVDIKPVIRQRPAGPQAGRDGE
jgi:tRNA (Thr-GGU) A37 N-methylase